MSSMFSDSAPCCKRSSAKEIDRSAPDIFPSLPGETIKTVFLVAFTVLLLLHIEKFPGLSGSRQFVQNFYYSAKISSNSIDELIKVLDEEKRLKERMPEADVPAYKIDEAVQFVYEHPFLYLRMCVKRFIAFWYPWIFAVRWSRFHLILDFFISLSLSLYVYIYSAIK